MPSRHAARAQNFLHSSWAHPPMLCAPRCRLSQRCCPRGFEARHHRTCERHGLLWWSAPPWTLPLNMSWTPCSTPFWTGGGFSPSSVVSWGTKHRICFGACLSCLLVGLALVTVCFLGPRASNLKHIKTKQNRETFLRRRRDFLLGDTLSGWERSFLGLGLFWRTYSGRRPNRICHRPDLTWHFLMWNVPAEPGCLTIVLAQTFEHTLRGTRWTRRESCSFFRCILCFCLSCPTCSAVPTGDLYCCVSCSPRPSARSRKPLPAVFGPGATVTFHFVCSSCFLPLKLNPSAIANVCFGSCVQEKPSAFHPTFLCRNSTDVRKTRADTFTDFHLEHFTHQLFEIIGPVIQNAEDELVSQVHTQYKHGTTAFLWTP